MRCERHGRIGCLVCGPWKDKKLPPRPTIEQYALSLAMVAATRSEDPYCKVGAVAMTPDNRVIATAYNGLASKKVVTTAFWNNRDRRLPFMLHAEQNLCSLFNRGQAEWIATTLLPCSSCVTLLIAHGIKKIVYGEEYERDPRAHEIADFYEIELCHVGK